jgi:DNA adenine methylase
MKYMGSKRRIAKEILPIVLKDREPGQLYIEPFCGGCNLIDKVDGRRWANDSDFYLVEMFKTLQDGWEPPHEVTRELYKAVRINKEAYCPALVAFIGFTCTFGAKWFGGYAYDEGGRNYARESCDNLKRQLPYLRDLIFTNLSFDRLDIGEPSIIYCDPPYANATRYRDGFNHAAFWEWVRVKSKEGHKVFVSDYGAPDDFKCLKEIPTLTTMNKSSKDVRIERLFSYDG